VDGQKRRGGCINVLIPSTLTPGGRTPPGLLFWGNTSDTVKMSEELTRNVDRN
jgi:hypothetical protein